MIKSLFILNAKDKVIIDWLIAHLPFAKATLLGTPIGLYLYPVMIGVIVYGSIPIILKRYHREG